jgi:hypothetical protein
MFLYHQYIELRDLVNDSILTIYSPMIYTAPCIMFWMRAYPLARGSGRGLGPGIREFFGSCEMASSRWQVTFGAQKTREFQGPAPSHFPK